MFLRIVAVLSCWWTVHVDPGIAADIQGTVSASGRGLSNAVVSIERIEGKVFPAPITPVVMDQVNLTFVPRVLPVLVGTRVDFPNNDVTAHNVFSPARQNRFDLGTYQAGRQKSVVCREPGVIPILCHIHHEMSAFLVVVETPYFAVSDWKGFYSISNVPPGRYRLAAWQERVKPQVQTVEVPATGTALVTFTLRR